MFKLIFFVPKSHLEAVKAAVFQAGAGQVGGYKNCCWQAEGVGQFIPGDKTNPFVGKPGVLETVVEYKVEVVVSKDEIDGCIAALKLAHPYEIPVFDLLRLEEVK